MIINISSLVILGISLLGMAFLIFRKIPALAGLSRDTGETGNGFVAAAEGIISKIPGLKSFSFGVFLQKILSQVRILSLKTDHQTFAWLQKLREKNQKSRLDNDTYWEDLKKSTTDKK